MRPTFLFDNDLDLVDFEGIKLLMLKNDNLYNISVDTDRKNCDLQSYQRQIREHGYPPSPVTPQNIDQLSSARYGLYLFLQHLWREGIDVFILDIGSHI